MSTRKKRKVIAGNWKMNMTPSEAKELIAGIYGKIKGLQSDAMYRCVETGALFSGTELMHIGMPMATTQEEFDKLTEYVAFQRHFVVQE